MNTVHTDCTCAPDGSELVYSGSGTGGRGSQWFFRKGEGSNEEQSQGFERRGHAEAAARDGWIKFKPKNRRGRKSRTQQETRA